MSAEPANEQGYYPASAEPLLCPECEDQVMGPLFKCSGCGAIACDGCIHHGMHRDAESDFIDMSAAYVNDDDEEDDDEE